MRFITRPSARRPTAISGSICPGGTGCSRCWGACDPAPADAAFAGRAIARPAAVKVDADSGKVKFRFLLPETNEAITHDRPVKGDVMRKTSIVRVATILAIALYFALAWGFAGLQAFTSSHLGLEDVWRSQTIFVLGPVCNLGPLGLVELAAFLAAVKLVAAAFCGVHALDRARGRTRSELLEAALIIIAAIAAADWASALWSHSNELFR